MVKDEHIGTGVCNCCCLLLLVLLLLGLLHMPAPPVEDTSHHVVNGEVGGGGHVSIRQSLKDHHTCRQALPDTGPLLPAC